MEPKPLKRSSNYIPHANLIRAAEGGDGNAAYRLFKIYHDETNEPEKAEKWVNQGAELGHADSMYELAMLAFGSNFDRTMYWLQEGAKLDHENCLITLGDYFRRGVLGTDRDKEKMIVLVADQKTARQWYKKASSNGSVNAKIRLGNMDVKIEHYSEALLWYQDAEKHGSGEAMKRIGDLYRRGFGVDVDKQIARSYYERAIAKGYKEGQHGLDALDRKVKHYVRGVWNFFNESSE